MMFKILLNNLEKMAKSFVQHLEFQMMDLANLSTCDLNQVQIYQVNLKEGGYRTVQDGMPASGHLHV